MSKNTSFKVSIGDIGAASGVMAPPAGATVGIPAEKSGTIAGALNLVTPSAIIFYLYLSLHIDQTMLPQHLQQLISNQIVP